MDIAGVGNDDVFRVSDLGTMQRCPRQLGYRRLGTVEDPRPLKIRPSATMLGGQAIDNTLNELFEQKIKGLNGLRGSALTDYFVTTLRKITEENTREGPLTGDPDPDVEHDGVRVLPVYERDIAPVIDPVSVQEVGKRTIADRPRGEFDRRPDKDITLVGHLDLVRRAQDGHRIVSDHKFTSKAPSQMEAGKSQQMHSYAYLKDGEEEHKAGHVELILLRRLKRGPEVATTSAFITEGQKVAVEHAVQTTAALYRARYFPMADPSSWACSPDWCGYYKTICRGRVGGPLPIPGEAIPPRN